MGCALNIKNTTMERMKEEEEEGERGISRQTRIVSSFFLSFKDKRKKQSGNKRSAKKCFPESLRNFKVWFALTLSCSGSEMCWRRWQRGDGSRSSLWTPPTPPKKKTKNYGMLFKSARRLRNPELRIWIQLQSKTSSGLTAHTLPENSQDGLRRRRRNTLLTVYHVPSGGEIPQLHPRPPAPGKG